jgi:hypothetical protein
MKKVIFIVVGVVAVILLLLLSSVILINNQGFQKKVIKRFIPYDVKFKKITISPLKSVKVDELTVTSEQFVADKINLTIKYKFLKMLRQTIDSVDLNTGKIYINESKKKKADKNEIELPKLDSLKMTIGKISITIRSIEMKNIFKTEQFTVNGSINNGNIAITANLPDIKMEKENISANVNIKANGKLFKEIDILAYIRGNYAKYPIIIDLVPIKIDLNKWEIFANVKGSSPKLAALNIRKLRAAIQKQKIKLDLASLKLSLSENNFDKLHLNNAILTVESLLATVYLDGKFEIAKGNIYSEVLSSYKDKDINLSNIQIVFLGNGAKNNVKINVDGKIIGDIKKEPLNTNLKISGNILDIGKRNIIDLSPKIDGTFRKNLVKMEGRVIGNIDDLNLTLNGKGVINEELKDTFIMSDFVAEMDGNLNKLDYNGKLSLNFDVKNIKNDTIYVKRRKLDLELIYKGNDKAIGLIGKLNIDDIATLNADVDYDFNTGGLRSKKTGIFVDLEKIPLIDIGVKKLDVENGKLIANIEDFTLDKNGILAINGILKLRDIKVTGNNLEKISSALISENDFSFMGTGNVKSGMFNGNIIINDSSHFINGEFYTSYNKNYVMTTGNLNLNAKRYIRLYDTYLYKGALSIPMSFTLELISNDFILNGNLEADRISVSSMHLKVNKLSGIVPIFYESSIASNYELPEPLENPIEILSDSEKKRYNLVIDRLYYENYYIDKIKFKINFNNFLDMSNLDFIFLGGHGVSSLTATQDLNFWLKFNFTNGYIYELLKNAPKNFSKRDTLVNIHSNIYGNIKDLNGTIKMPSLGRSVLLNILYAIDPKGEDTQLEGFKNKVKFLGYYPETIDIKLNGSTASLYVPLKKHGFSLVNLPFSIQNIPMKKIIGAFQNKLVGK